MIIYFLRLIILSYVDSKQRFMNVYELNIDGLVGPTHHYGGLSTGNVASTRNALHIANPAAAAIQGIQKMRLLHGLGLKQAIMPPHPRPNISLLKQLGFSGHQQQILDKAKQTAPELLSACFSASNMWTANAATVSPSIDTADHRVHFTAANLITNLHRHQEAFFSRYLLERLFDNHHYFYHHPPLPDTLITRDEGAANHNRLCKTHRHAGIHLFTYNQQMLPSENLFPKPIKYPARQTRESSEAIARSHLLNPNHVIFAQQNPEIVDLGVFHNDVVAVANESLLFLHEEAWLNQQHILKTLSSKTDGMLQIIEIQKKQLSIADAIHCYLFNSQLVTLPQHNMALIAPTECEQNPVVNHLIQDIIASNDNPINQVYYLNLKQSMKNGGGPACLRLRVVLNEDELAAMHQGILITDPLLDALETWVKKYYRTELQENDLNDPSLITESHAALDALTTLLKLGSIYPFQT